jgi:hypothetical protein
MAKPLLVAVMHSDDDDPDYHITSSAYGLEMQIDNEWRAELVLLTPPEFLDSILEATGESYRLKDARKRTSGRKTPVKRTTSAK